jgi:aminoglycoside 3-N-acetyltransferase I
MSRRDTSRDRPFSIRRLAAGDVASMRQLNALFAVEFADADSYANRQPTDAYLAAQLHKPHVIALVAERDGTVIGGLVAYELPKLEQSRSEIYIFDLAVAEAHRRRGIATTLIGELHGIARDCGAWVIYVQADYGDEPAVALYTKLGTREDVMHFDIDVA